MRHSKYLSEGGNEQLKSSAAQHGTVAGNKI